MPDTMMPVLESGTAPIALLPLREYPRVLGDALLPLVSADGDNLAEGFEDKDVLRAMMPIVGDITVEDAVYLYLILHAAMNASYRKGGERQYFALYLAWSMIEDFATHGHASTADCVSARAIFAIRKRDPGSAEDCNDDAVRHAHARDIDDLRNERFYGEQFNGGLLNEGRLPDWFHRHEQHFAEWKARS